ncbi:2-succinyl-6-hydroxy-2,4-cyclohexadiene-1-carboxylate synthase [Sansalvadorimonas verongulae]|uniref:2-succinyl-6-hydroxy-2, 4-cyclohexadiene-1-carboxylate synthase n=1 Tax=Sansalvadorimonas verongulae TaxID=2172824 RepID=UPI0012BB51E6|nr:2-succinyl-6-hydroxy-2,4-cyclohexadiene-1-carboxylate synthase [Sansalvadorimonas verongulae]MTI12810.1 2-succinyl-6-hydroxy-2,4-cyclohexadiene-1-carboxylate synthase [Sansalvadorimonas verongulae]
MAVNIALKDHGGTGENLILIHGFLGSGNDWRSVLPALTKQFHCYTVDLPGHGQSPAINDETTDKSLLPAIADAVYRELQSHNLLPVTLLGYSLGGRVAINLAARMKTADLSGLILEGAHPGLTTDDEKRHRVINDNRWAARFQNEPLPEVLSDWYQQPVFQSLTQRERQALIAERSLLSNGKALATILSGCSLGKQENLWSVVAKLNCPTYYVVGKHDEKFSRVANKLNVHTAKVPDAGHNAHRDNPDKFTEAIQNFISQKA